MSVTVKFHGGAGDLRERLQRSAAGSGDVATADMRLHDEADDRIESLEAAITVLEGEARILKASVDLYLKVAGDFQNALCASYDKAKP